MPLRKSPPSFDLAEALPELADALTQRLVLTGRDLKALGVPPAHHAEALRALAARGGEPCKGGIRLPLEVQLDRALAQRGILPKALGKVVKGASAAEAKALLDAGVRSGRMHVVVRGRTEVLVDGGMPVLSREELKALQQWAAPAKKALGARGLPRTLLREDVREGLLQVVMASRDGAQAPGAIPADRLPLDLVLAEARRLLRPDLGLCFVPELVLALLPLGSLKAVHAALGEAAAARRLELRPESGLNRLSALELGLCPLGLRETRLSWARPLEAAP